MPILLYLTTQDKFFLSHIKARALYAKEHGFDVIVAAQKTSTKAVLEIKNLGFDFYDTKIERRSLNLFSQIKAIWCLSKLYRRVQPSIVHHLGAKAIIYGTIAHKLAGLTLNSAIVNAPIGLGYVFAAKNLTTFFLKPFVTFLYKFTLEPSKGHVIFENPDDLDFFVSINALNRQKASCIYGAGVDTDEYSPSTQKNDICTVVMASRLIKEKGVFEFIKVARLLKEQSIPVRMQLVGQPDYGNPNSLTQSDVEQLKNSDFIEYLGYRNDMSDILKRAHICCLPSFYREGLPRFLIEGACSGLAIITTDTVGCREVVANCNGYLVKPHDTKTLTNKICVLVNDPMRCQEMGFRSRQLSLNKFDIRIVNRRTFEIYKKLLH